MKKAEIQAVLDTIPDRILSVYCDRSTVPCQYYTVIYGERVDLPNDPVELEVFAANHLDPASPYSFI